jgi:hypothetical protein
MTTIDPSRYTRSIKARRTRGAAALMLAAVMRSLARPEEQ